MWPGVYFVEGKYLADAMMSPGRVDHCWTKDTIAAVNVANQTARAADGARETGAQ